VNSVANYAPQAAPERNFVQLFLKANAFGANGTQILKTQVGEERPVPRRFGALARRRR
jgi:hypothetical protein